MAARARGMSAAVVGSVVGALVVTTGGVVATSPASAVTTDQSYWVPANDELVVDGHGYGHGHGMSQHGAQGAATRGLTHGEILDFYYPGTRWGTVKGKVRVLVTADTTDDVVVSPASGLSVRDLGDRSVHSLPVGGSFKRWRLVVVDGRTVVQRYDGGWKRFGRTWNGRFAGDVEFFAKTPITLWTPSGRKTYRGTLRAASPTAGSRRRDTVNVVSVDQYVMGVVPYEMPASWHPQAVRAQAVAARTYATWSRNQNRRGHYQICDTTSCQVYGGVSGEDPRSNDAVRATARKIRTYGGTPAFTQFSASSGGWTSAGSVPYLPAQKDPYDAWSGNSVHSWTVTVDAGVLERKYPRIGALRRLRVTHRDGNGQWRGRVTSLVLDGTDADVTISGDELRWAYGLRSNWFSIRSTPIITRWRQIGGAGSVVGDVRGAEYSVASGVGQRFDKGRIFDSANTAPREVHGPILTRYRRLGGPSSTLGFPRSRVVHRGGGNHYARFEGGSIFHRSTGATLTVTGAIERRWRSEGAFSSGLGWPKTSNYKVNGGQRVDFARGAIIWRRSTNSTRVIRH